jgi:hypothetical protein
MIQELFGQTLRVDGDMVEAYSMTASEILQNLRMKITLAVG